MARSNKILLSGSEMTLTAAVLSKPRWLRRRAVTVFTQPRESLHCSSLTCFISKVHARKIQGRSSWAK
jgi:hypothetical protein